MNKSSNFENRYFKKIVIIGSSIIGVLICVLMLIIKTDVVTAATDWKESLITKANMDLSISGQDTTDELLAKEIEMGVDEVELDEFIKQQQTVLDNLIIEYYYAKTSGLTSENDLNELQARIVNIRSNLYIEYQGQIDTELKERGIPVTN